MKFKNIYKHLSLPIVVGSLSALALASSCNKNPVFTDYYVNSDSVKKQQICWLNSISDTEGSVVFDDFRLVNKDDASTLKVEAKNVQGLTIKSIELIDRQYGAFALKIDFKANDYLVGNVCTFDLIFSDTAVKEWPGDTVTDFGVLFATTDFKIINGLAKTQNLYTSKSSYAFDLVGGYSVSWGIYPIRDVSNFYVEVETLIPTKCTITPEIVSQPEDPGYFGIRFNVSNIDTRSNETNIQLKVLIKNKKLPNWVVSTDIEFNIFSQFTDCYKFEKNAGYGHNVTLTAINSMDENIEIPSQIVFPSESELYTVTNINLLRIENKTAKTLTLPSTVTSIIGSYFDDLKNLDSIKVTGSTKTSKYTSKDANGNECNCLIQNELSTSKKYILKGSNKSTISAGSTHIKDNAFNGCKTLNTINIPSSMIEIGLNAFDGCTGLKTLTFEQTTSLEKIGNYAFKDCSSLLNIALPDSITTLGDSVLENCSSLKTATLPSAIATIPNSTFSGCKALQNFVIPSGITTIGNKAFSHCESLTSINIPSSVTSIDNSFGNCSSLTTITVDTGTKYKTETGSNCIIGVDDDAIYQGCNGTDFSKITTSTTQIAQYAFEGCDKLENITIPSWITSIGAYAFNECTALKQIVIPSNITFIGTSAFANCTSATKLDIKSSTLTALPAYGFEYCTSLNDVVFANNCSITTIGTYTFAGCLSLKNITLPESLTTIYKGAFSLSGLESLEIPKNVSSIQTSIISGAYNLKTLSVNAENTKYTSVFSSTNCNAIIDISNSNYPTLMCGFNLSLVPQGIKSIADGAFAGSSLKAIQLPNTLEKIGEGAFSTCYNLASFVVPSSVTKIGKNVFNNCIFLESVIFTDPTGWYYNTQPVTPISVLTLSDPVKAATFMLGLTSVDMVKQ